MEFPLVMDEVLHEVFMNKTSDDIGVSGRVSSVDYL